jgi:hypothetical protein
MQSGQDVDGHKGARYRVRDLQEEFAGTVLARHA